MKTPIVAAALAVGLAWPAHSAVYISLASAEVSGGAPTEVATGADFATWAGPYGSSVIHSLTASNITDLLDSIALDVFTEVQGVLTILFSSTDQDIDSPVNSHFTSNALSAGYTLDIASYLDPTNTPYGTAVLLGAAHFDAIGTADSVAPPQTCQDCSVTAVYTITHSQQPGTTLSTAKVSQVPEPGTLGILGAALLGMGMVFRRRSSTIS